MAFRKHLKQTMHLIQGNKMLRRLPLKYSYVLNRLDVIHVPELNVAFVPNPKVANRSIKLAMATRINPEFRGDPHNAGWKYVTLGQLQQLDCFKFGFVRNPLDRLISCYKQKILLYARTYNQPVLFWRYGDLFHPQMSFEDFVIAVSGIADRYSDIHFRSQHTYFYKRERNMIDFIGRFENLDQHWQHIDQMCKLGALPHLNPSTRVQQQVSYSPRLVEIATKRYKKDIELFGYEKQVDQLMDQVSQPH